MNGINKFIDLPHCDNEQVALCISLTEEVERRQKVLNQCNKFGIKVEFVIVERHNNPVQGCLESHLLAISIAKQRGYPWVLIFEDDVVLTMDWLHYQIKLPVDWEMCMLGHNILSGFLDGSNLIKVLGAYTTHAYIVRNSLYNLILNFALKPANEWPNYSYKFEHEVNGIDVFYRLAIHSQGRTWAVYPMLATQQPGYSSIEKKQVDYTEIMVINAERAAARTAKQYGLKNSLLQ